ncbi:trehalose-6-phosphate synthase [Brevibacterium otitidis]|uniref:trehalose-6-phosphate synthase n=1 Tax=Brevibacterium otitidis TaxID=53364 RepID=UPI00366D9713
MEARSTPVAPPADGADFVVVANRLPVDRDTSGETPCWRTSPGGLVTGVAPVMQTHKGAWIGWAGVADEEFDPFDIDGMHLVPVPLSSEEVRRYYEGFSNATLWPLYHDVIVPPEFHRTWWNSYRTVNRRFAEAVARTASEAATVWVHDYQLQLVPYLLRGMRPDVRIGFFNHIPFPPWEIFAQLPWRAQILRGLLGADLIGFQRPADAQNFRRAVRICLGLPSSGNLVKIPAAEDPASELGDTMTITRTAEASAFPISIDTEHLAELARDPQICARAKEIRAELGNPDTILLGVDRMDYTKGIRHRLKAYGELFDDGVLDPGTVTLVQIATPSRERIDQYQQIRTDVELAVGRINGEHSDLGHPVIHYFHHSYPRDEMTALYLAADVMLVTALRDGMNLVAKEYVACQADDDGVLVLSEFTGAAEQLTQAVMVNPHDIAGLKSRIAAAVAMDPDERRSRMRKMRESLAEEDVRAWSDAFLSRLQQTDLQGRVAAAATMRSDAHPTDADAQPDSAPDYSSSEDVDITALAAADRLLVGLDFDGVIAPLVDNPMDAAPLPASAAAVEALAGEPNTVVGYISGRNLAVLKQLSAAPEGTVFIGSHGVETDFTAVGGEEIAPATGTSAAAAGTSAEATGADHGPGTYASGPSAEEQALLDELDAAYTDIRTRTPSAGHGLLRIERKPLGRTFHTRGCSEDRTAFYATELEALAKRLGQLRFLTGHDTFEFALRHQTKGNGLEHMIRRTGATAALYIGDDRTDEDAFKKLRTYPEEFPHLSIKVGPAGTAAEVRLHSPEDVAVFLGRLAAARNARH